MSGRIAFIYNPMYNGRGFSRLERSWGRYQAAYAELLRLGLVPSMPEDDAPAAGLHPCGTRETQVDLYCAEAADDATLLTVHSADYIAYVREMDARGEGFFDRNDTPAWRGVFRRAALSVGGTVLATDLLARGDATHAFHPAGGLHHAARERASGFCIFNDIVAAVRHLQQVYGYERIAVLDVDGHHGDGTQALLYDEPILTVSIHHYDGKFFPRTGTAEDRGEGAGTGYAVNLPLPRYAGHPAFMAALEGVALPAIARYRPQALIVQFGVDGHYQDRMAGIRLTTRSYAAVARAAHNLAHNLCGGRVIFVGGGGYEPQIVRRCWAILMAILTECESALGKEYIALHDPADADLVGEPAVAAQVAAHIPYWRGLHRLD